MKQMNVLKIQLQPHKEMSNGSIFEFLEQEMSFEEDERNWNGEHLDLKKRVLADELPVTVKQRIMDSFYSEKVTDDQLDAEVGIMQLVGLRFDETNQFHYMFNAGYYAYGRNGWDLDEFFDFFTTPESVRWTKEISGKLNRLGWETTSIMSRKDDK